MPAFEESYARPVTLAETLFPSSEVEKPTFQKTEEDVRVDNTFRKESVVTFQDSMKDMRTKLEDSEHVLQEEELLYDQNFLDASQKIAEHLGDEWTDDYGLRISSEMTANIGGGSMINVGRPGGLIPVVESVISSGDPEAIMSLMYMMEMYERKPMTWDGTGRFFGHMLGDISNYMGGAGLFMKGGKKLAGGAVNAGVMQTLKTALKKAIESPVAVGMAEGGVYGFADNLEKQRLKKASGLIEELDLVELGLVTGGGTVAGGALAKTLVSIPAGVRATINGAKTAGERAKLAYEWAYDTLKKEREGDKAQFVAPDGRPMFADEIEQGGGGIPKDVPKVTDERSTAKGSVAKTMPLDEFLEKATPKELQAYMRNATPEEKPAIIAKMKSFDKKAKAPKAKEQITVQEEFNEQFYSRLEQEVSKIPPEKTFNTPKDAERYLLKQGVKPREIEASGVLDGLDADTPVTGAELAQHVDTRHDKITKRVWDEDDKVDNPLEDQADWEDGVSVRNGEQSNQSDSGTCTVVTDERNGSEVYIETRYNDEVYVDNDGREYEHQEMLDDWYDNYMYDDDFKETLSSALEDGDIAYDVLPDISRQLDNQIDAYDRSIARGMELNDKQKASYKRLNELADSSEDAMESDETAVAWVKQVESEYPQYAYDGAKESDTVKQAVMHDAEDTEPWRESYEQKVEYEVGEYGNKFDDEDEAVQFAKDTLYEEYEWRHENDGGEAEIFEGYSVDGGENYHMNTYRMENFDAKNKDEAYEPHMNYDNFPATNDETTNIQVHSRVLDRTDNDGKDGKVVEEVQSQWEQDWRKEGGENVEISPEEATAIEAEMKPFNEEYFRMDDDISVVKRKSAEVFKEIRERRNVLKEEFAEERANILARYEEIREKPLSERTDAENEELLAGMRRDDELSDKIRKNPEVVRLREEGNTLDKEVNDLQVARDEYYRQNIKPLDDKLNPKIATLAPPPMKDRTEYERVAILDELTIASQEGKQFFGWNNSGIQNGSRTPDNIRQGMKNAYDLEIPRIIQKETGQTPYKAYHDGRVPSEADREYWDYNKAKELGYDEPGEWYWRIDLDDELTSKLNDSKINLYSAGGATLIGGAVTSQSNNEEQ